MMLLLKHTGTGKGEFLGILCWTDSVCEVLPLEALKLCWQFLSYLAFLLFLSFVPLNNFVLVFVVNGNHFLP